MDRYLPVVGVRLGRARTMVVLPKGRETMERVTLRIPKQQIEEVEQMVEMGEFPNRSEAIRSAVRTMLNEQSDATTEASATERGWVKV